MADRLDDRTRECLRSYLADVKSLPNESAKTTRFAALIGELFPGTRAVTLYAQGIEKGVRIDRGNQKSATGRVDSYYGNAVIEFERSLRATGRTAEQQLREYVAAIWSEEGLPYRPLLAIASDGIVWRYFTPRLHEDHLGPPTTAAVALDLLQEHTVSEESLADFWLRLTSLLFRDNNVLPTAEQLRLDFGSQSPGFRDAMSTLRTAWQHARCAPEALLAFENWRKYLVLTYGSAPGADEDLFLRHTYLASLARLLVWASLSKGRTSASYNEVAEGVLSGSLFERHGLANLVEDDFFTWAHRDALAAAVLEALWERLLVQVATYDLSRLGEDVLKGIYQELVDPEERHDLGEFYTPDWLCEAIVRETLPAEGFVSVLDPTCGSGSFLRAAIRHLLACNPHGTDEERLSAVVENVVGIDIHPLAVTIARATYLLALGDLVRAASRPIQIPVYMADSLFLPTEVAQLTIGKKPSTEITFATNRKLLVPTDLVQAPEEFDGLLSACARLASAHAKSSKETQANLAAYLRRTVPSLLTREDWSEILSTLWAFVEELAGLIRTRSDSIWIFILRNGYRPAMLKGRFDFILGNPPWLTYRDISDPEYQREVKRRVIEDYALVDARDRKLHTHLELATVFMAHAIKTFAREGGAIGFVMPRSVLSADQHAGLRLRRHRAPLLMTKYWDLRDVKPLFNVPACVVFGVKREASGFAADSVAAEEWTGRLPRKDLPWEEAAGHLQRESATASVIYLGKRSALSTVPGNRTPTRPSLYAPLFRQGATLVPRNFYFIDAEQLPSRLDSEAVYRVETDREQASTAKAPWKDVLFEGLVEGRFFYSVALAKHLLPYVLLKPATVVLPLREKRGKYGLVPAEELKEAGFREMAEWMERAEERWGALRRSTGESVYEWLDYQGKLTHQDPTANVLVLYNASGKDLVAATVDVRELARPFIVDAKLYWYGASSLQEAAYLVAVLNAGPVNDAIKPFQSMGAMGERDIHKKVLDLPIPRFDPRSGGHAALAELSFAAESEARKVLAERAAVGSLATQRAHVRSALRERQEMIDARVRELLGLT